MVNNQQVNTTDIYTTVFIIRLLYIAILLAATTFKMNHMTMEHHNLELVKSNTDKTIPDQCINGSPNAKSRNATSGHFLLGINCRNLFLLALFFTTLNVAQNAPLPPTTIIVFSITSNNPLHMVLGDSPYVTTDISMGKSS